MKSKKMTNDEARQSQLLESNKNMSRFSEDKTTMYNNKIIFTQQKT